MRKLIIALGALAVATPVAAQPRHDPRDEEIVRALPAPHEVERVAETVERVTDALMDVDVGPVVDAVEGRRHSRRHRETLGDLATRDDPYARERVREQIGAATVGVAAAVEQLAVMTPVLRRSLEDAAHRVEDAMRRGRDRAHDRRYERHDEPDRDPRDDH